MLLTAKADPAAICQYRRYEAASSNFTAKPVSRASREAPSGRRETGVKTGDVARLRADLQPSPCRSTKANAASPEKLTDMCAKICANSLILGKSFRPRDSMPSGRALETPAKFDYNQLFMPFITRSAYTGRPVADRPHENEAVRFALEAAGIGIFDWDFEGDAILCSDISACLLGAAPGAAMNAAAFCSLLHPCDRDRVSVAIAKAKETGDFDVECRVGPPDGRARWLQAKGWVVRDPGAAATRMCGVILSIESRKQTEEELRANEERLRSILDGVPDAMIIIGENGVISSFSAAAERLFGHSAQEAIGQNISILMPEPDSSRHDRYVERYIRTGERRIIGLGRVVIGLRKDGSTFPIHLSISEMHCGADRQFIGFARDLTERQETQAKLQELQSELVHVSRLSALGEMASSLAHELNQPLAAINNYIKGCQRLLQNNAGPHAQTIQDALEKAADQALRAGEIIRRQREFVTRRETQKTLQRVSRLVEEASALALIGARERGVIVRLQIDSTIDCVFVDGVQIQQVLVNLFRNALEAMHASERRELIVTVAPSAEIMVEIMVSDTGEGISTDILPRLFEPFVTSKATGMGVGLSISKSIIEAHGGRLWAEANPLGGTVFHFTIPAEKDATSHAE